MLRLYSASSSLLSLQAAWNTEECYGQGVTFLKYCSKDLVVDIHVLRQGWTGRSHFTSEEDQTFICDDKLCTDLHAC